MTTLLPKALAIWLLIAVAEVLHGILRVRLLNRWVGDHRARQIGVFTGSGIILVIAWFTVPWLTLALMAGSTTTVSTPEVVSGTHRQR